jgi:hypothetical protein
VAKAGRGLKIGLEPARPGVAGASPLEFELAVDLDRNAVRQFEAKRDHG